MDGLGGPDPNQTSRRRVTVIAVAVRGTTSIDDLLPTVPAGVLGIIAVGQAAWIGLELAARLGAGIERLVLVAVPAPVPSDSRMTTLVGHVRAKTLIVNGQRDPQAASRDATWLKNRMVSARVKMVPSARLIGSRLTLGPVWDRLLQHCGVRPGWRPSRSGPAAPPTAEQTSGLPMNSTQQRAETPVPSPDAGRL
jgi:hypothetical protein